MGRLESAVLGTLVAASCYRAEIEIAPAPGPPPDAAAGASAGERGHAGREDHATAGAGDSGASASDASAGKSEAAGGAGTSTAGLSGAAAGTDEPRGAAGDVGVTGAAGAANCTPDLLPEMQVQCRVHLPSRATCSTQVATGWNGCSNGGCTVCDDMLVDYPYYFRWHPCCVPNSSCVGGRRVKCNERCPPPTPHDRLEPCGARIRLTD